MTNTSLSLDALAKTIEHLTANRIYFLTSWGCPRVNEEGKAVMFKVPFDDETVWVMHPTLLPKVAALAKREEIVLVEFDIEEFLRKQCTRLTFSYLDEVSKMLWSES